MTPLRQWLAGRRIPVLLLALLAMPALLAQQPPSTAPVIYPRNRAALDGRPENRIAEAEFFRLLDPAVPLLARARDAAERGDYRDARALWRAHLSARPAPSWVYSREEFSGLLRELAAAGGGREPLALEGDRVLAREFNLGGSVIDFKDTAGRPMEAIPWDGRVPGRPRVNPRARQILNHLHHWVALGRAYRATGYSAYAADFDRQVPSWDDANPMVDKHWAFLKPSAESAYRFFLYAPDGHVYRSLCLGIRIPNLAEALELLVHAPEVSDDSIFRLSRMLAEQCRFLTTLAKVEGFRGSNWQIIESTGLAQGAMLLPEVSESREWLDSAMGMLAEGMRREIRDDGWQSEITPAYHGWVAGQYTQVLLLARRNGVAVGWDMGKFELMYEALLRFAAPDGTLLGVGDSLAGSIEGTAAAGALLFGRGDFRSLGPERLGERMLWLFGPGAPDRYASIRPETPRFGSLRFPVARYSIFRTGWDPDADLWALFDGAKWEGHSHNDALQFVLHAGRRPLLVDPGMCDYSHPRFRQLIRSSAHNIVLVGAPELPPRADPTPLAFETGTLADFAAARLGEAGKWRHRRSVLAVKPLPGTGPAWNRKAYYAIADFVHTSDVREVRRFFHFPAVEVSLDASTALTRFSDGPNLQLRFAVQDEPAAEKAALGSEELAVGPQSLVTAPKLELTSTGSGLRALWTLALPHGGVRDLPNVTARTADDGTSIELTLTFPDGHSDWIEMAAGSEDGVSATLRRQAHPDAPGTERFEGVIRPVF